jgi:hypothetical protein
MKSVQWEWECGRTDRQTDRETDRRTDRQTDRETDMPKLIVAFSNFTNAPNKCRFYVDIIDRQSKLTLGSITECCDGIN